LLPVRATVTHHVIVKNVTLTFGIFIFHFYRDYFTYFWNAAHGHYFGDVQVSAVGVVLNNRGVLAGYVSRGFLGQGGGGAQAAEGHN